MRALLTSAAMIAGCGALPPDPEAPAAETAAPATPGVRAQPSASTPSSLPDERRMSSSAKRPCGTFESCSADEFCVATQGALCEPLPPAGAECGEGCVRTEHCCNCTAKGCLRAPHEQCPDGPSCACLDGDFLSNCTGSRRECTETPQGVDVVCIAVGLDENPFQSQN